MKTKLLISGCFCGYNTKYNGKNNRLSQLELLQEVFELYPVCPEVMGGLDTPRNPSEIRGEKVFSNIGTDVTPQFVIGALEALRVAKDNHISLALLKESSPSCGKNYIYDGSFSGKKISGMGKTARLLHENGIMVFTENEIDLLLSSEKQINEA